MAGSNGDEADARLEMGEACPLAITASERTPGASAGERVRKDSSPDLKSRVTRK